MCVCVCMLTLSSQLVLDCLHPSLLLDEVVDDLGRFSVLQLSLRDAAHVEQVLQFRVQVIQLLTKYILKYALRWGGPYEGPYGAKTRPATQI